LKTLALIVVVVTGALLVVAAQSFPRWGDPGSPASQHVSPRYIAKSLDETEVPNIVTSVLADYRGFDTLFETAVVFTAGTAVFLILRVFRRKEDAALAEMEADLVYDDIIVRTIARVLVPFIQIFALYVVMHGHHSPGGGFQGGVMLGAGFIILAISFDLKTAMRRVVERTVLILGAVGVLIYAGLGALAMVLGGNFLDYGALGVLLPNGDRVMAHSHGMLGVEIGVAIAVMSIMVAIYGYLASRGRMDRGF